MTDDGFLVPGAPDPAAASPIADLTYRTYDGPLHTRAMRWWIVALSGLRATIKMKGFWIVAALALLPYLIIALQLYLQGMTQGAGAMNPFVQTTPGQKYAAQFVQGLQYQALFLFIMGLVVGSGCIARDNQANALLVYLSKPLTKADYVLGKWMAVFLAIFSVAFAPALVLYLYCLLSYTSQGFLREEPWLILRVIGACAAPAAIHSSLLIGFSAWSKTGRMAGAFYAGLYFLSSFVSSIFWLVRYRGDLGRGVLERHLHVGGVIEGLAQNIYGVTQRMPTMVRHTGSMEVVSLDPPALWPILLLAAGLCAAGIVAARLRIRAVEVVRG